MTQDDFNAWLELAKTSSYKSFVDNVPNRQALLDMALAVE